MKKITTVNRKPRKTIHDKTALKSRQKRMPNRKCEDADAST
jgi:hypothetical protein